MSYFNQIVEYGRTRRNFDGQRFVADLAKALGGAVVNREISTDIPDIDLGDYRVRVYVAWNAHGKVSLHISERNAKWLGSDEPSGDEYRWPEISVSVDRPMTALVKDINRRLIEPAAAPLAKRREHQARIESNRGDLRKQAERLRAAHPSLDVHPLDKDQTQGGSFFNRDGSVYLNGRFYHDGRVQIDRIGSLSAEQFDRVMAALNDETNKVSRPANDPSNYNWPPPRNLRGR